MKKLLGILGVTVIAVAMFLTSNIVNNSSSDITLDGLLTFNSANAEVPIGNGKCYECGLVSSDVCMTVNYVVHKGYLVIINC